jgi:hypothetical protein
LEEHSYSAVLADIAVPDLWEDEAGAGEDECTFHPVALVVAEFLHSVHTALAAWAAVLALVRQARAKERLSGSLV